MSLEIFGSRGPENHETKQYPEIQLSPFFETSDGQTLDAREHSIYEIGDPKLFSLEELYAQVIEDFNNADKDAATTLANSVRQKYAN